MKCDKWSDAPTRLASSDARHSLAPKKHTFRRLLRLAIVSSVFLVLRVGAHAQTGCTPTSGPGFVYDKSTSATASCISVPNVFFPTTGGDFCAQINNAITSLPSTGGTIDARGLTSGLSCPTTITVNKQVTLLFGAGSWTFGGSPGINISAPNVVIECPASSVFNGSTATTLFSGAAAPLIANFADPAVNGYHTADGTQVVNCNLNGNNLGTFGVFAPAVYTMKIRGVHVTGFTGANILAIGGQNDMYNTVSDDSMQDGVVWGLDSHVSGLSQSNGNKGDGWHVVSGGNVFDGPTAYLNGLYGMHFDGNQGDDWVLGQQYVEPKIILPLAASNSKQDGYYTQQVGTSSTTGEPNWSNCQNVGCVIQDGSVYWINVGNLIPYSTTGGFTNECHNVVGEYINGPGSSASNNLSPPKFSLGDEIFVEGENLHYASQIILIGAQPDDDASTDNPDLTDFLYQSEC